jgi:anthranilate synthase/aminodeoxychorismate synthase-like glutamine amidotransferase
MILLIDNYDSFVHNLARYFRRLGQETVVQRNDEITLDAVSEMSPAAIVLSPGPCTPKEAGVSLDVVKTFCGQIPILGVCLGHQAICEALGGNIIRATEPMHGRMSQIMHTGQGVFAEIPQAFEAGRYHSLIVDEQTLPDDLIATAHTADGTIMAVEHRDHAVVGLQFHPESILTDVGFGLLGNFLQLAGISVPENKPSFASERRTHEPRPLAMPRRPVAFQEVDPL